MTAAAIDEFTEHGFHGTKISGIVKRAGVTQPSFYIYFESKDALLHELIERVRTDLRAIVAAARIPAKTPSTAVRGMLINAIELFLSYFEANPRLASIGFFDRDRGAAIREEIVGLVAANISFEQGQGFCRLDLDPMFVSQCYNGSLDRLIRTHLLTGEQSAREIAERVADLYGLGTIPEGEPRRHALAAGRI